MDVSHLRTDIFRRRKEKKKKKKIGEKEKKKRIKRKISPISSRFFFYFSLPYKIYFCV